LACSQTVFFGENVSLDVGNVALALTCKEVFKKLRLILRERKREKERERESGR
jgi:hypothetical protein